MSIRGRREQTVKASDRAYHQEREKTFGDLLDEGNDVSTGLQKTHDQDFKQGEAHRKEYHEKEESFSGALDDAPPPTRVPVDVVDESETVEEDSTLDSNSLKQRFFIPVQPDDVLPPHLMLPHPLGFVVCRFNNQARPVFNSLELVFEDVHLVGHDHLLETEFKNNRIDRWMKNRSIANPADLSVNASSFDSKRRLFVRVIVSFGQRTIFY